MMIDPIEEAKRVLNAGHVKYLPSHPTKKFPVLVHPNNVAAWRDAGIPIDEMLKAGIAIETEPMEAGDGN